MLRSLTFGLFLVVGGVTPAAAQSLERAEAAYFRGDYADAMQMMRSIKYTEPPPEEEKE